MNEEEFRVMLRKCLKLELENCWTGGGAAKSTPFIRVSLKLRERQENTCDHEIDSINIYPEDLGVKND